MSGRLLPPGRPVWQGDGGRPPPTTIRTPLPMPDYTPIKGRDDVVRRTADKASVPVNSPTNRDSKAYQAWLANQAEAKPDPDEADEAKPDEADEAKPPEAPRLGRLK